MLIHGNKGSTGAFTSASSCTSAYRRNSASSCAPSVLLVVKFSGASAFRTDGCQWRHRQGGTNVEVGKGGGATAAEVMDGTGSGRKDLTSSFHMATKTADNGQCNGG